MLLTRSFTPQLASKTPSTLNPRRAAPNPRLLAHDHSQLPEHPSSSPIFLQLAPFCYSNRGNVESTDVDVLSSNLSTWTLIILLSPQHLGRVTLSNTDPLYPLLFSEDHSTKSRVRVMVELLSYLCSSNATVKQEH